MEIWLLRALTLFSLHNYAQIFCFPWQGREQDEYLYRGGVSDVWGERRLPGEWEVEEGKPFPSEREQIKGLPLVSIFLDNSPF